MNKVYISTCIALFFIATSVQAQTMRSSIGKEDPVFISADSLRLEMDARVFFYEGNVEVLSGELNILSNQLSGTYDEDSQIDELIATGAVSIQSGPDTFAEADHAHFRRETQTIVLTKSPSVTQGGNVLSADVITLYLEEDRSEASGQVRVKLAEAAEGQRP